MAILIKRRGTISSPLDNTDKTHAFATGHPTRCPSPSFCVIGDIQVIMLAPSECEGRGED